MRVIYLKEQGSSDPTVAAIANTKGGAKPSFLIAPRSTVSDLPDACFENLPAPQRVTEQNHRDILTAGFSRRLPPTLMGKDTAQKVYCVSHFV